MFENWDISEEMKAELIASQSKHLELTKIYEEQLSGSVEQ